VAGPDELKGQATCACHTQGNATGVPALKEQLAQARRKRDRFARAARTTCVSPPAWQKTRSGKNHASHLKETTNGGAVKATRLPSEDFSVVAVAAERRSAVERVVPTRGWYERDNH